ncbi:hypothetical protein RIF29_16895 [Crotalaria pallida]|uniref:Uncharacterized protein n=1 Tax=Crotalaria pallida TaxID=3830 RepID=A0AAN9FN73_CROPI
MAKFRCFSFLTGIKDKNMGKEKCSKKEDFQTLLVKLQHPRFSSKFGDLETTTFDVTVPYGIQKNSMCDVKVTSVVKAKVEQAYEGESEKKARPSINRELSDFDLRGREAVAGEGRFDHGTDKEVDRNQANNQLEVETVKHGLNHQREYSSDILEPKQGKALRHVESSESVDKIIISEDIDNQQWRRLDNENSGFCSQNQWLAFSTKSPSFHRVHAWVKNLEIQQPLPEDDFNDGNGTNIVFPPSPGAVRSLSRSTSKSANPDANLSKEVLIANSMVNSLSLAATIAHISGVGIKVLPAISHLTNLRSVDLSCNLIVHILHGFLPKGLHTLSLLRNKISTFEGLRELTRLRVLDLSYNCISRIGQGLSKCTSIKELYLAGNKISDVEGLHRLLKLTVLDLSFNKITTTKALGQLVANYNSLQALNLLGNPIQSNISNDQLRKAVFGLLPKLVYLNKQLLKPQRAHAVLADCVSKAALGNSCQNTKRKRSLKKIGQGGSSSSRGHMSIASDEQKIRKRSRSRN